MIRLAAALLLTHVIADPAIELRLPDNTTTSLRGIHHTCTSHDTCTIIINSSIWFRLDGQQHRWNVTNETSTIQTFEDTDEGIYISLYDYVISIYDISSDKNAYAAQNAISSELWLYSLTSTFVNVALIFFAIFKACCARIKLSGNIQTTFQFEEYEHLQRIKNV